MQSDVTRRSSHTFIPRPFQGCPIVCGPLRNQGVRWAGINVERSSNGHSPIQGRSTRPSDVPPSDTGSTANGIRYAKCQCGQHHYDLQEWTAAPSHNPVRNARRRKVSIAWGPGIPILRGKSNEVFVKYTRMRGVGMGRAVETSVLLTTMGMPVLHA